MRRLDIARFVVPIGLGIGLGVQGCYEVAGLDGLQARADAGTEANFHDASDAGVAKRKDATSPPRADGGARNDAAAPSADGGEEGGFDAGCAPMGTGAVAVLSCPCSVKGALACNGNDQYLTLICLQGAWAPNQTCVEGQRCQTELDAGAGTCADLDPNCAMAHPGEAVCNGTTVVRCGPDLVGETLIESCGQPTPNCAGGACTCPGGDTVTNGACCGASEAGCNGSCVNEKTDVQNCGACGTVCSNAHGTTTCASGVCKPLCNSDFFDCDGNPDNGCETAFIDDGTCVACGHHCTGTMTCLSNGECACGSNADCNGGSNGNCDGFGVCSCFDTGATPCAVGQRCDAVGACDWVGP